MNITLHWNSGFRDVCPNMWVLEINAAFLKLDRNKQNITTTLDKTDVFFGHAILYNDYVHLWWPWRWRVKEHIQCSDHYIGIWNVSFVLNSSSMGNVLPPFLPSVALIATSLIPWKHPILWSITRSALPDRSFTLYSLTDILLYAGGQYNNFP